MSQLDKVSLNDKYNNASTGRFKTGQSRGIGSDDHRELQDDIRDSLFNLTDHQFTGAGGFKHSINTIANLKALSTVSKETGIYVAFRDTASSDALRMYELVAGTNTESSPDIIRPNDYAAATNEKVWKLATGVVFTSKVTISSAEILTLFTTPKTLIAAPGANQIIDVIAAEVYLDYNSAIYATNTSFWIGYNAPLNTLHSTAVLIDQAFDVFTKINLNDQSTFNTAVRVNTPLVAYVSTGNPTAGNSPIYVYLTYRIITL